MYREHSIWSYKVYNAVQTYERTQMSLSCLWKDHIGQCGLVLGDYMLTPGRLLRQGSEQEHRALIPLIRSD